MGLLRQAWSKRRLAVTFATAPQTYSYSWNIQYDKFLSLRDEQNRSDIHTLAKKQLSVAESIAKAVFHLYLTLFLVSGSGKSEEEKNVGHFVQT